MYTFVIYLYIVIDYLQITDLSIIENNNNIKQWSFMKYSLNICFYTLYLKQVKSQVFKTKYSLLFRRVHLYYY